MRSGPGWLWLGVAWMINDWVVSIRTLPEAELPGRLSSSSSSGGGSGGGGGNGGDGSSGKLAVLVNKFSVRFFRFQRGELVVLR